MNRIQNHREGGIASVYTVTICRRKQKDHGGGRSKFMTLIEGRPDNIVSMRKKN
jgi:hypothetical protein